MSHITIAKSGRIKSWLLSLGAAFAISMVSGIISAQAEPIVVAQADLKACRLLDRVEGSSGYGKPADWRGLAKRTALKRAERLGASHIVWENMVPVGAFNGTATAAAYRCNSPEAFAAVGH